MKKIITILFSLFLCLLLLDAYTVKAETTQHIFDEYGAYTQEELNELNQSASELEDRWKVGVYIKFAKDPADPLAEAQTFVDSITVEHKIVFYFYNNNSNYYYYGSSKVKDYINDRHSYLASILSDDNMSASAIGNLYFDIYWDIENTAIFQEQTNTIPQTQLNDETQYFYDESGNLKHYVDYQNYLDSYEQAELEQRLIALKNKYQLDVVIVFSDYLRGKSAEAAADDYFDYAGYGADGILFLVSKEDRKWHISTSGRGIDIFTDYGLEQLENEILPYLSQDDFYKAFDTFIYHVEDYIMEYQRDEAYDYGNKINNPKQASQELMKNMAIALVSGLVFSGIVCAALASTLRSVRRKASASDYLKNGSLDIQHSHDMFMYSNTTRRAKPKNNSGSRTHFGSSGRSHGGRGGSF